MADSMIRFPTLGSAARDARLLAIDDTALPFRKNLSLHLTRPTVRPDAVLTPSRDNPRAPDHLSAHFYGTVLHEGGRFRVWYYSVSHGEAPGQLQQGPMCYAESDDGIHWTKPNLGQVEFRGSRENNAIALPDQLTEGVTLIRDDDDPDPARRYKLLINCKYPPKSWSVRPCVSADGLHWTTSPQVAIDDFVEQASFFKHGGLYLVHAKSISPYIWGEGGSRRGRTGMVWASPDFDTWVQAPAEAFALTEPQAAEARGPRQPYDQVHLGVGAASFGNVCVGLYGLWHNREYFHDISCDLGLVVSHDGVHFREPVRGHAFIRSQDSSAPPLDGQTFPTVLCQSNGILNVGDETRIYHGRWRNARYGDDYYAETALATLPRDRWGALALYDDAPSGVVWSAPIELPAGDTQVRLNAEGAAGIRVHLADESFHALPSFSGEQAGVPQAEAGLDCAVTWPSGSLAPLAGQRVRLQVTLERGAGRDPRLYAVYLEDDRADRGRA